MEQYREKLQQRRSLLDKAKEINQTNYDKTKDLLTSFETYLGVSVPSDNANNSNGGNGNNSNTGLDAVGPTSGGSSKKTKRRRKKHRKSNKR